MFCGFEEAGDVVALPEVLDACRGGVAVIAACHRVWHEVDDYFHPFGMGALHELAEFVHAVRHVDGHVGVDVVVVADGVGRACLAFHHSRIIG